VFNNQIVGLVSLTDTFYTAEHPSSKRPNNNYYYYTVYIAR